MNAGLTVHGPRRTTNDPREPSEPHELSESDVDDEPMSEIKRPALGKGLSALIPDAPEPRPASSKWTSID